jgi:cobalt-zinc-cadmium efflux system protein
MGGHHHHHHRVDPDHRTRLAVVVALTLSVMVAQVVVGLTAGSLALLSDAGHMATDAAGVTMALVAATLARRPRPTPGHTFGLHRVEILAALANAVLLGGVAVYIIIEAIRRLGDPPSLDTGPVLVVGTVGLVANLVGYALLRPGAQHNLNVRGASLEVLADAVGSVMVIVATTLVWLTDWTWWDTMAAVAIGAFIVPRSLRLGRAALRVLVEAAPEHLDPNDISVALVGIPTVVSVHDLHVWTLTSGKEMLMAHVAVNDDADTSTVLAQARQLLHDRFGITHATIQVERGGEPCEPCRW